jgi:hypothetical protein
MSRRRSGWRWLIFGASAVVVLTGYGWLVWSAPGLIVGKARLAQIADAAQHSTAEYNARVLVVSMAGATVVIIGLAFTARTYALSRRGQVTERFTKALERLGSDEPYVRLGGVHSLEHVMADSADHELDTVEVLVAFVRDQVPRHRKRKTEDLGRWMHPPTDHLPPPPELPAEPTPDVQAALTALGRQPSRYIDGSRLNLAQLHLARADLRGAELGGANLGGAYLGGANLGGADLRSAELGGANLAGANLGGANLGRANLGGANLGGANLGRADLGGANLRRAELGGADLGDAILRDANLGDAILRDAYLGGVDLGGADLSGADLSGADLSDASLVGLRWNYETTWPTQSERAIRSTSNEVVPGAFVVRTEPG